MAKYPWEDAGINNITEIGAEYLAKRKLNLKELYLSKHLSDSGWNSLGLEGTKQLSSANWPRLKKIWLGNSIYYKVNNQIGPKGVKYIAKANWKCLEELNVGSSFKIQVSTTSTMKAAPI